MSTHLDYSNVLLACIDMPGEDLQKEFEAFDSEKWQTLLQYMHLHGIGPMAFLHLQSSGLICEIPSDVQKRLAEMYANNLMRNTLVFMELDSIIDACHQRGIPIIPLKGAYLGRAIYDDPGIRVLGDLDIQSRPDDALKVAEILRRAGYNSAWQGDAEWKTKAVHVPEFSRPGSLPIELHLVFTSPYTDFHIDDEGIWQRAVQDPNRIPGCMAMAPEDLFLFLCNHIYRAHFRIGLRHLIDLRSVITNMGDRINPDLLMSRAREWRMERILLVVLTVVDELFGCRLQGSTRTHDSEWRARFMPGIRSRIFREENPRNTMGLLYWSFRYVNAQRKRPAGGCRRDVELEAQGRTMTVHKMLKLGKLFANQLKVFLSAPIKRSQDIRNAIREERFDRWMNWD